MIDQDMTAPTPAPARGGKTCVLAIMGVLAFAVQPHGLAAAAEQASKPGDSFKECAENCPEMVVVPAGQFVMGSPANEKGRFRNEGPQHTVTIPKPFAVSKFEVTFDEWDACVADGGCEPVVDDNGWGRGRRPVINVTWHDARRYAAWLSKITGKPYRLPSEAEWEYAARAGSSKRYSWGDEIGKGNANCRACGSEWDAKQTAPVGSFPANQFGLYDMHGNVWEWVEDCLNSNFQGAPTDGSAWTVNDCPRRVIRGGSWHYAPEGLRSASRLRGTPTFRFNDLGFRVARSIAP
jgi:formylglycine-generating enzyme required for sulfatase activity